MFYPLYVWLKWTGYFGDYYICLHLRCVTKHSVLRFYLSEICARDWFCILPRMNKSMALFHIKKLSCHGELYLYFKENFNMWVKWGTSRLFCWSVCQMGQQVRPTFNPAENICTYVCICTTEVIVTYPI